MKKKQKPTGPKRPAYIHHQYIPLEDGIKAIIASMDEREKQFRHLVGDYEVHTTSLRLRVFATKGTTCYLCGNKATQFSIDTNSNAKSPHMNLWGMKDGKPMLFTHDHIIDRAKGGADQLHNAEPCCTDCNWNKNVRENYGENYQGNCK